MPAPTPVNTDRTPAELRKFADRCKDLRQRRRVRAIAWRVDGMAPKDVAAKFATTPQSIRDWVLAYNKDGVDGLKDKPRSGRPRKLSEAQCDQLKKKVEDGPDVEKDGVVRWRVKDLQAWIKDKFGISVGLSTVHRLLHKLGFRHLTSRPRHPKADVAKQKEFCKEFEAKARKEIPEGIKDSNVEIWFQDELRYGQKGTLTRLWALKNTRPPIVRDFRYGYQYLFAATRAIDPQAVAHLCDRANTIEMNNHLALISKEVRPDNHAVLVLDGAGWHRAKALVIPDNISLLFLPPYSPELNPVEQVFAYLRANNLSNRLFATVADVRKGLSSAWDAFRSDTDRITTLTTRSWATLNT